MSYVLSPAPAAKWGGDEQSGGGLMMKAEVCERDVKRFCLEIGGIGSWMSSMAREVAVLAMTMICFHQLTDQVLLGFVLTQVWQVSRKRERAARRE